MTIWFPFLRTDYFGKRHPLLLQLPFALTTAQRGKIIISEVNSLAQQMGAYAGMPVADARVLIPHLEVRDDIPGLGEKLLQRLAEWCIRFTPHVAVDLPVGLKLDISGCAHLWQGETTYLNTIISRLQELGYHVRAAIADTVGAAWAVCRFGKEGMIVLPGEELAALETLPPACLRIDVLTQEKLYKIGCYQLSTIIKMPVSALRRRFGALFIKQLQQALGVEEEWILPVLPGEIWQERLACLDPIVTATGISIALEKLLGALCSRLQKAEKGLRIATLTCYRLDGRKQSIQIGTNRPSMHSKHLYKLFEVKLDTIEPDLGIELFVLDATGVEKLSAIQHILWESAAGIETNGLAELLDRLAGKIGIENIYRYLPAAHYWPERSYIKAAAITDQPTTTWLASKPRPLQLLDPPHRIEVSAPIPDYPPMLFSYKNSVHRIVKADGPERIEQEWWLQQGEHRDYYYVEDDAGQRYWLFRSGHYAEDSSRQWYLHGFFA